MIEDGRVRARERESEIPARLCTPRISDMDLAMKKLYPNLNVPEETEMTKEGESFKLCSGKHHALLCRNQTNMDLAEGKEMTKEGDSVIFSVSLELANNATLRKYQELQKHLSQITIFHKSALGDEERPNYRRALFTLNLGVWWEKA